MLFIVIGLNVWLCVKCTQRGRFLERAGDKATADRIAFWFFWWLPVSFALAVCIDLFLLINSKG